MANTSRPGSAARRAVMSEPTVRAASTTRVPSDEPGDDAVAAREVSRCGTVRGGNSDTSAPRAAMRAASAACSGG